MSNKDFHVANTSDLRDGEMKEVLAGETRILLARVGDRFYAVSANCTHYGAPLAEGALCGTRIVCPWHHAVFNIVNGDLEEPPALDALISYDVNIEGTRIFVSVPDDAHVVVGASFIGMEAAYSLRERGFEVTVVAPSRPSTVFHSSGPGSLMLAWFM